jgi:glycosyltransferase involved in cell wall biosynthesis
MTPKQPNNNPLVSVIIPVYNGERYLSDTIRSVIAQSENNWEIVAVNDGSTDRSLALLEDFAIKFPDRIRVISVNNGGVSRARNTGVTEAKGDYIAFLDQDDLWMPQKLQLQVEQFRSDKNLGISYTNESIIDHAGSVVQEKVLIFKDKINRGFVFEYLVFENFVPISSVMIRKDLFTAIGGFDPQYSLAEDYDFILKAVNIAPVDYIDAPLLLYREHGESGTYKKIDQITKEAFSIFHSWKTRDPWLFRRHFFKCLIFWVKFKVLKLKILMRKNNC